MNFIWREQYVMVLRIAKLYANFETLSPTSMKFLVDRVNLH